MKRQNNIFISFFVCVIFLQIFVDCKQHSNNNNDLISTLRQYLKNTRQENTNSHQIQQEELSQENKINSLYSLPNNQVDSLTDLFYATNGYQWDNSTNWLNGDPCYNLWFGVYCNYPYNNTVLSLFVFLILNSLIFVYYIIYIFI